MNLGETVSSRWKLVNKFNLFLNHSNQNMIKKDFNSSLNLRLTKSDRLWFKRTLFVPSLSFSPVQSELKEKKLDVTNKVDQKSKFNSSQINSSHDIPDGLFKDDDSLSCSLSKTENQEKNKNLAKSIKSLQNGSQNDYTSLEVNTKSQDLLNLEYHSEIALSENLKPNCFESFLKGSKNYKSKSQKWSKVKTNLTASEEIARFQRQHISEYTSFIVMLIAAFFFIWTPILAIPLWLLPNINCQIVRIIIWSCFGISMFLANISAFIGNIYWYFDSEDLKLKWTLHCGRGPRYFWGQTIFNHSNLNLKNLNPNVNAV